MSALGAILDIPEAPARKPVLDPAIYVEPKDRDLASEDHRQAMFVSAMRRTARKCLVAAVPNGAKRSQWERRKVKREGLYTGYPDVIVNWRDHVAYVEFKNGKDDPSDAQIETLNWLHERGHKVAICRTMAGAMAWLRSIGAPVPEVRP